jgi:F-type H+-transporting ATPase subunit a
LSEKYLLQADNTFIDMNMCKYILGVLLGMYILFSPKVGNAVVSEDEHETFNTVDYVFEHVGDSYEWHFFTINDFHATIPLPVILYSKYSGWHFFMSNKFHYSEAGFPFHISDEGKNKGKIVEILENGSEFVPFDFSLTRAIVGLLLASLILILVTFRTAKLASRNINQKPTGLQNLIEPIIIFIRDDVAKPFAGEKYKRYLPFLLTLFTFILVANILGLVLPLGINITGNIAITMVLALFTFLITTFSGNKHYWKHIFNPEAPWYMKSPVLPLMQFIEVSGMLIKPIILMIRLFANMLSGHMIIAVLIGLIFLMSAMYGIVAGIGTSIISIIFSVFIVLLDLLVSFIQAYIFAVLTAMYFGMATEKGH